MPFVNGQFVYQDDFDYGGRFRNAYADTQKRMATEEARNIYREGDADRAAEVLMPFDPAGANVYAQAGERTALRNAGRAYATGNFDEAARIYGDRGNVQGAEAARTAGNNRRFSRQVEAAQRYRGELRRIGSLPDAERQPAYEAMLAKAEAEADDSGKEFIGRLRSEIPTFTPEAAQALDGILLTAAQAYSTRSPETFIENWVARQKAQGERFETLTPEEVQAGGYRPGTVVQRNVGTGEMRVVQSPRDPSVGGGHAQWRRMTPEEQAEYGSTTPLMIDERTGNVKPAPGNTGAFSVSAEARTRIGLALDNFTVAARTMGNLEREHGNVYAKGWGVQAARGVPLVGGVTGAIAELGATGPYKEYEQAWDTMESAILPLFSGTAVTESEAVRFLRANKLSVNDTPETAAAKQANRNRLANVASMLVGVPAPFPELGIPAVFQRQVQQAQGGAAAAVSPPSPPPGREPSPNQLGPTPGAPPPRPPNVPPTARWDPAARMWRL